MWMGLMDDSLLYLSTLRQLTVWSLNHVTDFWALTRCRINQLSLSHSAGKSTTVTAVGDDSRYVVTLLLRPWLVPSSGVADVADDLISPFYPVCCIALFQTHLCHVSLCIFPS